MDKTISFLAEWAINFIKNKDIYIKSIKEINQKENKIIIKYKDKEETYIIIPYLSNINNVLEKKEKNNIILVILNNKENLDQIIKNWNMLIKYKNIKIIFINPFSELEKKWVLNPYFHNKIADEDSLKKGLTSLFGTVDPIDKMESYLK